MSSTVIIFGIIILWFIVSTIIERIDWKKWWKTFDEAPFNFPFQYKGRTLWYSRSCAVASFIFAKNRTGEWCVAANKRGEGTPDYQGYWNAPCGYCSFNETLRKSAQRETHEELGLILAPERFEFLEINDDPKDSNKQNITMRYFVKITDHLAENLNFYVTGLGEKNEVDDRLWIPISQIDDYKWAFNHGNIIKSIFQRKIVG